MAVLCTYYRHTEPGAEALEAYPVDRTPRERRRDVVRGEVDARIRGLAQRCTTQASATRDAQANELVLGYCCHSARFRNW